MRHIPNFITSLNLASGFAAVIFAGTGDILTASWLILAAMVFDFCDGFSARLLKAYSAIGKELDSLADVVSFGVAPGIIIYNLLTAAVNTVSSGNPDHQTVKVLLIVLAALMPVSAAIRLAVFNLDESQAKSFKGLPTPANALAVISLVIAMNCSHPEFLAGIISSVTVIAVITLLLSLLMVSRVPLLSLKVSDLRWKGNEGRYILAAAVILLFAIFGTRAAPLVIPVYILSSLLALLF